MGVPKEQVLLNCPLNQYIENVINILIIVRIFNALSLKSNLKIDFRDKSQRDESQRDKSQLTPTQINILQILDKNLRKIVIRFKKNNIDIYFPYFEIFKAVKVQNSMHVFQKISQCNSQNQRLSCILSERNIIYTNMEIMRNHQGKVINQKALSYVYNLSLFLSALILLLLIFGAQVNQTGTIFSPLLSIQLYVFSKIQLILTFIYGIMWGRYMYKISQKQNAKKQNKKKDIIIENFLYKIYRIYSIKQDSSNHSQALFAMSILANTISFKIYSLCILFPLASFDTLGNIINSFKSIWSRLLMLFTITILVSFIFGVIFFDHYVSGLFNSLNCNSLIKCLYALYMSKSIGSDQEIGSVESKRYVRYISDLVYFIIFEILITNLVGAIIIDKYSQLRNQKDRSRQELRSKCIVCGININELQYRGERFEKHINDEHNLMNYYFYMYLLENIKVETQLSSLQYYVQKCLLTDSVVWFPIAEQQEKESIENKNQQKVNQPNIQQQMKLSRTITKRATLQKSKSIIMENENFLSGKNSQQKRD